MQKFLCYLLIFLYSFNIYCDDTVVYLEEGKPAPYTGYLFNPTKEKELRLLDVNLTYYKSFSESLQNINKAQEDNLKQMDYRLTLRDKRIEELTDRQDGIWGKIGFFILGSVITGLVSYGVYKLK